MRQYELRTDVTDEVKIGIVKNCVFVAKTLKGMFPVIWEHELDRDIRYMQAEAQIACSALTTMNALVGDTDDEEVMEAKAYLEMLIKQYHENKKES